MDFSGSQSSGFAIDEVSIIDDDQGRPRVVKLKLAADVVPRSGDKLSVSYTQSQVAGPRPPGVLDQQRNRAPSFPGLEATWVPDLDAPALSVADTRVREAPGAMANFPVTLQPAATAEVTVEYETYPVGSATPGEDYAHTTGELVFSAGQTAKTISVPVHDDDHEDSGETFRLRLDNPTGGGAYIADAWAVATITNDDPVPEPTGPAVLTAEFVSVPKGHLGSPFTFVLRFSEEVSLGQQAITGGDGQQSVLSVTGGAVTGASRIDEEEGGGWNVTVTPSGKGNVAINLPATTDCSAGTAVCTADSRPLSAAVRATVIGLLPPVPELATIPPAGDQLQLSFDRAYDNRPSRKPPSSAFVVNADGAQHVVSGVETSVSNRWLRLSFTPPVKEHQTVTVSYRDPTERNDTAALQLRSGEDAESFSGFAAINGSTVQDPVAPELLGAVRLSAEGDELSIRFTRAIDLGNLPAPAAFTVTFDGTQATVAQVRASGADPKAVALDINPAVPASAQSVTVTYSDPTAGDDEQALQNRAGVDAESFTRPVQRAAQTGTQPEVDQSDPLTAEFWKLPTTHGGGSFSFELVFSDEPFSLTYTKLVGSEGQASVLSVAYGEVTEARRLVSGKNHSWEISIAPAGHEDVTISLPASTDCAAETAICTEDGRPLSVAVVATVESTLEAPPPPPPLTATFEGAPREHRGRPFVLRVRFSEAVGVLWPTMRDHVLSVTNGRVARAHRPQHDGDSNALWEITIEPSGGDVTVELPATTDCEAEGAVCTEGDLPLSSAVTATVAEGTLPALKAAFADAPLLHDGSKAFEVKLNFTGAVTATSESMRGEALRVTNGRLAEVTTVNGRSDRWLLTVEPTSIQTVTLALVPADSCDEAGAVCAPDGRKLSSGAEASVNGPASVPLIVRGQKYNRKHDGSKVFELNAVFGWPVATTRSAMHKHALLVTNGEAIRAFPKHGQPKTWVFWIKPLYNETVRVELPPTTDCAAEGAVCTEDGRPLVNRAVWEIRPRNPNKVDETAPEVRRAEVDGARLEVMYTEGLDETSTPDADAFSVTVAGRERSLAASNPVSVNGRRVTLTLASAVASGDTVTVSYAAPASNPIQDRAGNRTAASTDHAVTNHTPATETTVPELEKATAGTDAVVLTYSEALDEDSTPAAAAFTVTVAEETRPLAETDPVAVSGSTVTLTFASAASPGDTVTVSYAAPTEDPVRDAAGNRAASASITAVVPEAQLSPTDPVTMTFDSLPARHALTPFTFRLAFSEEFPVDPDVLRDAALDVTNGRVTGAERVEEGRDRLWEITVEPSSRAEVTIAHEPRENCAETGAICTDDGRGIAEAVSAKVLAPVPAPSVTDVSVTSGPGENGTWDVGETVTAEVRFSAPVTVTGPPDVGPMLGILLDGSRREAGYTGGSGSSILEFSYTATAADAGKRRARVAADGLTLNGAVLGDSSGQEAELGFSVAPYVAGVELVADASGDRIWTSGEAIAVNVAFSEAVTVSGGTPTIGVTVGDEAAVLDYASGSGGATLVFSRSLTESDSSLTRIGVTENSLTLEGARIVSQESGLGADLSHDGTEPTAEPEPDENALTAAFSGLPASHGGESFTFRIGFSEALGFTYKRLLGDGEPTSALSLTGGSLTRLSRVVQGASRDWNVTVTPDGGDSDVAIVLAATSDCAAANAICAEGGRPLSASVSVTVPATAESTEPEPEPEPEERDDPPPAPFTVRFEDMPGEHDGSAAVTFKVHFSEEPHGYSYRTLRDHTLEVRQGGTTVAPRVRRLKQGSNRSWKVTAAPVSNEEMRIAVSATTNCAASGAVCTEGGEPLSSGVSATVLGPPGLSVSDAAVTEAAGAALEFAVTLSRAASSSVTVDYATSDGTATAGVDYTTTSGTLTFAAGDTLKTVSAPVLDDAVDDDGETLTLTLSNASGAYLSDATATGTIENSDSMPRGMLARFGRAAALQVLDYVEERLRAQREPGFRGRLAGNELDRDLAGTMSRNSASSLAHGSGGAEYRHHGGGSHGPYDSLSAGPAAAGQVGQAGGPGASAHGSHGVHGRGGVMSTLVTRGDVLSGSSFTLNRATDRGGMLSIWSRGARTSFSGREEDLGLDGSVRTAMAGADYAQGPVLLGLSLARSWGLGDYTGRVSGGRVTSSVTGLYPWLGYRLTDRVTVFAVGGHGMGGMVLRHPGAAHLEAGLSMSMVSAGARGRLAGGGASGFRLSYKADAFWVGTSSKAVSGPSGNLSATRSSVSRLRAALECLHTVTLRDRLSLQPSVALGLRRDGGDAETGSGVDMSGGLVVADRSSGLQVDVRVRMLLAHETAGYRERDMAVSLSYDPAPDTPLGLSLRMSPSWGGQASSGSEALWGRQTMAGMASGGYGSGDRMEADLGYGLPLGVRFVGTPRVGISSSRHGRDYRVGYRVGTLGREGLRFELGVDGHRRENSLYGGADNGIIGRLTLGW